jgi:hypothetical protein
MQRISDESLAADTCPEIGVADGDATQPASPSQVLAFHDSQSPTGEVITNMGEHDKQSIMIIYAAAPAPVALLMLLRRRQHQKQKRWR